jgi:pimeloyl-ACP methyl ester carboxylesterase/DNA-binding CsgD family transcriptional regulator
VAGRPPTGQRLTSFEHRGRRVAVATVGDGPPLVCDLGRLHHLDVHWRHPPFRRLVEALARHFTVIRFDRPGCGLSDRAEADFTLQGELALFDRLLGELRLDRVALLGSGSSVPVSIAVAATRPERLSRLALFGPCAHQSPQVLGFGDALESLLQTQPQFAIDVLTQRMAPALGSSEATLQWMRGVFPQICSGPVMAQFLREGMRQDVRRLLGHVRCPTLVLHRRGDRLVDFQEARDVAAHVPDAVLLPLDGSESLVWDGDQEAVVRPLLRFLADLPPPPGAATVLTAREREIAGLVAGGLTNAAIGERLGIGRRTVESHLESARAKIGLLSRTDLAAWIVRSRLEQPG